jgi:hypothetical protein
VAPDGPTVPTSPPDRSRLVALDDELWRRLLVHLRRALREAPGVDDDPRLRRLAALPTSRLVAGRARRDAAAALAGGGPLWLELRRRVVTDPELGRHLGAALAVDADPAATPPPPPAPAAATGELDRLRDRLKDLRTQRDDAVRRADGERARADREVHARGDLERRLATAEERVADLERRLEEATRDRVAAVDRERRRGEAARAELAEELRRVRRERQERARRERAADRAAEARASAPAPARPERPPRLLPGRPSRLPDPVRPDTTEAVDLLLHAGRRVLVDGYNVTRSHRDDLALEAQRRWLVNLLAGAAAARRVEPRVVFDGHATPGPGSQRRDRGVVVSFTPEGITADDDLVFAVEAMDPEEPVVVVTDDRGLRERLAPYRVDLVSTTGFLGALR